jgi:hypothetical protein
MSNPKILDEQGILLFNLNSLIRPRGSEGVSRSDKGIRKTVDSSGATSFSADGSLYPNVCLFDSNKPGEFLSYLKNRATKNKVISDTLLKMSTFELSSLVPYIRLFKIYYNPINGKEVPIEMPFETKADGIESVFLDSTGRGVGAGITSVEWKHAPKFEASAPIYNLILRLHLQNVEEFFKTKNAMTLDDGKTIARVSIQDLMYQSKEMRKLTREGTSIYNPDYYKIKLIVGWAISENSLQTIRMNSTREDVNQFVEALKEQTEVMFLTFVNHDIQFNDDGSIDLQLNYLGSAEVESMDLVKSNVLYTGPEYEKQIQDAKEKVEQAKQKAEEAVSNNAAAGVNTKPGFFQSVASFWQGLDLNPFGDDAAQDKEREQEAADSSKDSLVLKAEKDLESLKKSAKRRKYTYMFRRMLQKKHVHLFVYDQAQIELYSQMAAGLNYKDGTSAKTIEKANQAVENAREAVGVGSKSNGTTTIAPSAAASRTDTDNSTSTNAADASAGKASGTATDEEASKKDGELFESILEGNFSSDTVLPDGKKHIPFFYLSSLVDVLLEGLSDSRPNSPSFITKDLRVILGPITITDFGTLSHNGQVRIAPKTLSDGKNKIIKTYTGKPITINIGDIPISLKAFTSWFKTNIMDKNLEEITFNEFMTTLMQELVINSLTNDVYSFAPPQKINLVFDMFSTITSNYNEGMFIANIQNYRWSPTGVGISPYAGGFRIDVSKMHNLKTNFNDFTSNTKPKNYVILYSFSEAPMGEGDVDIDSDKGIYHFYYGESRGVIRNIKFSRTDNPHVRTDSILNSNGDRARTGGIVREKYNVNLEIFGNTDIQAGTYIYLSPSFPGSSRLSNTERLFKDIGLGGYYFVTEVHNTIEIGEFVTKIKAVWQTSGETRSSNIIEPLRLKSETNQLDYIEEVEVV